jgi:hypothetical protein
MSDVEPVLQARSASEKEAAAWWFRQLCTTLIIANAGGVIAVSGFAANTENIAVAALIAYPATPLFLAGSVIAATGIIFQFLYTSWRIEALGEYDKARNEWRNSQGLKSRISVAPTLAFFALMILTLFSLAGSAFYFYRGAKHASLSTTALACASLNDRRACGDGVWLFGRVDGELNRRAKRAINLESKAVATAKSISPDAFPDSNDEKYSRQERFMMRRAADIAGRNADCKTVEIVDRSGKSSEEFAVTCSNGSSLRVYKVSRQRIYSGS